MTVEVTDALCACFLFSLSYAMSSRNLYPLASLAQIETTPSQEDGIPEELEEDLRAYGCKIIHQAGILLQQYGPFPQDTRTYPETVRE